MRLNDDGAGAWGAARGCSCAAVQACGGGEVVGIWYLVVGNGYLVVRRLYSEIGDTASAGPRLGGVS